MLLLASTALAGVVFERDATTDSTPQDPLDYQSPTAESRVWYGVARERATRRSLDFALTTLTAVVAPCAGPAATVVAKVSLDKTGALSVAPVGKSVLGTCLKSALNGRVLPVLVSTPVSAEYTVRWDGVADQPAVTAAPEAFCLPLDAEPGFSGVPWGALADTQPNLDVTSFKDTSRFYRRLGDSGARWFGADVLATFAFGPEGFYAASVGGTSPTAAFHVREALTARYGTPRWDAKYMVWYWRGNERILQFSAPTGTDTYVVTLLDMGRARRSGMVDRLPGDPVDAAHPEVGTRLPKIYQQ